MVMDKYEINMNMGKLWGYYYAMYNYLRTPKGRHDAMDYTRAAVIIVGIAVLLIGAIQWWQSM